MSTNTDKLGAGQFLSEAQYYHVDEVNDQGIIATNDRGFKSRITLDIVKDDMYSADQFEETKQVSKTELAEIFSNLGDAVFTVAYHKQLDSKEVIEAMQELYPNSGGIASKDDYMKRVASLGKTMLKGEERILIGYKLGTDSNLGRSHVIDLQQVNDPAKNYDTRQRLVDHRTIKSLIYKNVKYVVK